MATSFGPSALATPANAVTIARLVIAPFLLLLILGPTESWPALVLWIALSATDGVDGYLARRQGTTRSGAFLDPLADKVLVVGALLALVAVGRFWWAPVALIVAREVAISVYRARVGRQGVSVPARWWAKVKTVVQSLAVGVALLPPAEDVTWVADGLLWVAVVLTLVTGAQYLLDSRDQ
ncbi:MAG TPA: CDP-diacylglycerol--glycerol-3-phosphate 3-phosphatidyltransferase [Acidimicrobiales bacterium]